MEESSSPTSSNTMMTTEKLKKKITTARGKPKPKFQHSASGTGMQYRSTVVASTVPYVRVHIQCHAQRGTYSRG